MKREELREKKQELIEDWEKCFDSKVTSKINEKGIAKIWDDNTSLTEVISILTSAGIDTLIESVVCDAFGLSKKDEPVKNSDDCIVDSTFSVYNKVTDKIVAKNFDTFEHAEEEAKNICLNNGYKLNTMLILESYEI